MSLFKARDWWSTVLGEKEEFDQGCLCVADVDNSGQDKIIVGSYMGYLRIFNPHPVKPGDEVQAEDLLLEVQLREPILQVEVGKFVSGTEGLHLAVLHCRRLCVYAVSVQFKRFSPKYVDDEVFSYLGILGSHAAAFDKGYAYSIRHNYGKEGKRTDYTPYSCMKIIMSNPPSQGDYHGCPFRHSDPELLKQKLQSSKVPPSGVTQILELVKGMHYQLACQKYFELTHDVDDIGFSLNHPNQYFAESQRILSGGREVKKELSHSGNSQQKNNSQESVNSNSTPTTSNMTTDAELEGLEAYFTED